MHEKSRLRLRRTGPLVMAAVLASPIPSAAVTYYVRQTVGDDAHDGLSAATAWRGISKLSPAMQAGDTAYVGPGLYREQVTVMNGGTPEKRVVFIADTTGQHTGDPPGPVMITGADPVAEDIFAPHTAPGVYQAEVPYKVAGVVEMDGPQHRYARARDTKEHLVEKMTLLDVVVKRPASHFYDEAARVLYVHTSDGKPPGSHEIELIRRGTGIGMSEKHYVTVIGFTFRHTGDAGVSFFKGSGHGIAMNNTSYGSRQGVRVYEATDMLVYGNTLFRNDNSGVYFAKGSVNGLAVGNVAYENTKGIRWSSQSVNGMAIDNTAFDNREAGIAIEDADHTLLRRNVLLNNGKSQLMVIRAEYGSESNCFHNGRPDQLTADFVFVDHFKTLAEYRRAKGQDLHSRDGACGRPPAKVDVGKLHAETMGYAERARRTLAGSPAKGDGAAGAGTGK